ncbi:hypothetical protein Moror_6000 [Moniliophthora roreri MCA 2997]|uniref:Uncharacterized protein n=1 Tax=Moniliophthora roreri (strain MCA 2997) TaxID=1381753 RepID=V2WEQ5_MONRO|nr:hypothetical protein Moror_6000 [Moniliophthora roreri MCA 2997]
MTLLTPREMPITSHQQNEAALVSSARTFCLQAGSLSPLVKAPRIDGSWLIIVNWCNRKIIARSLQPPVYPNPCNSFYLSLPLHLVPPLRSRWKTMEVLLFMKTALLHLQAPPSYVFPGISHPSLLNRGFPLPTEQPETRAGPPYWLRKEGARHPGPPYWKRNPEKGNIIHPDPKREYFDSGSQKQDDEERTDGVL